MMHAKNRTINTGAVALLLVSEHSLLRGYCRGPDCLIPICLLVQNQIPRGDLLPARNPTSLYKKPNVERLIRANMFQLKKKKTAFGLENEPVATQRASRIDKGTSSKTS